MNESQKAAGHATNPPPEGFMVARTERSPGFGDSTRLPGFPVAFRVESLACMARCPLQWRGRAGFAPASE